MSGLRIELCDECGVDAREPRELATALADAYASLERLRHHPDAGRRPQPNTWSGSEYVDHCLDVADQILALCSRGAGTAESQRVMCLSDAAAVTEQLVHGLSDSRWDAGTDGWPFDVSVRGAVTHLLHDLEHHIWDVRRGYAKLALADGVDVVTSR